MNDNEDVRWHVGFKFIRDKLRDRTQEVGDLRDFELIEKIVIKILELMPGSNPFYLMEIKEDDNE